MAANEYGMMRLNFVLISDPYLSITIVQVDVSRPNKHFVKIQLACHRNSNIFARHFAPRNIWKSRTTKPVKFLNDDDKFHLLSKHRFERDESICKIILLEYLQFKKRAIGGASENSQRNCPSIFRF